MSTKKRRTGQSSSRSEAARKPPQQLLLPDDIEKENAAVLDKLPRDVWEKIVGSLGKDSPIGEDYAVYFPFVLTCRYFRDLRQDIAATDLSTLLESYSYMTSIDGDMVFSPTIHEGKYPLLPLIFLCLLSLTLCLAQPSMTAGSPSLLTT